MSASQRASNTKDPHSAAALLCNDTVLLSQVSTQHSRDAFEELVKRYELPAYNLAYRLVGNRDAADDVVQEAFLNIWRQAHSYDPKKGTPRAWILRIVAHSALDQKEKMQKSPARFIESPLPDPNATPSMKCEQHEEIAAVRSALANLPESEAHIISLYFGAGLSQEEIASSNRCTQQAVSTRINTALRTMRTQLERTGFAAAAVIAPESIRDAVCTGQEPPAGMRENVLAKIASQTTPKPLARPSSLLGKTGRWAVLSVGAVVLGFVAKTALFQPMAPGIPNKPTPAGAIAAPNAAPNFNQTWDFNDGPPKGLTVLQGAWHYLPNGGADGKGCMVMDSEELVVALDDLPAGIEALSVTVDTFVPLEERRAGKTFSRLMSWDRMDTFIMLRGAGAIESSPVDSMEWKRERIFLSREFSWVGSETSARGDNEEFTSLVFLVPARNSQPCLLLGRKHHVDNLSVRTISTAELPSVDKYRQSLAAIPPSERHGVVMLPQFKTGKGRIGNKVEAQFVESVDLRNVVLESRK